MVKRESHLPSCSSPSSMASHRVSPPSSLPNLLTHFPSFPSVHPVVQSSSPTAWSCFLSCPFPFSNLYISSLPIQPTLTSAELFCFVLHFQKVYFSVIYLFLSVYTHKHFRLLWRGLTVCSTTFYISATNLGIMTFCRNVYNLSLDGSILQEGYLLL